MSGTGYGREAIAADGGVAGGTPTQSKYAADDDTWHETHPFVVKLDLMSEKRRESWLDIDLEQNQLFQTRQTSVISDEDIDALTALKLLEGNGKIGLNMLVSLSLSLSLIACSLIYRGVLMPETNPPPPFRLPLAGGRTVNSSNTLPRSCATPFIRH